MVAAVWTPMPQLPGLVVRDATAAGPPILHVDADAFFVSVEQRDAPELADSPLAVAHDVVLCASYDARANGVLSGVPVEHARARCPDLNVVPPRMDVYRETSVRLFELLANCVEVIDAPSSKEAYLDLGTDDWDDATDDAIELKRRVGTQLGIPITIGIGRTKMLAAVATRQAKPDGLSVITPEQEEVVRARLSVGELPGVGRATRTKLKVHGIESVNDLGAYSAHELAVLVGAAMARRLFRIAHALDDARVLPRRPQAAVRTIARRPIQLPLGLDLN